MYLYRRSIDGKLSSTSVVVFFHSGKFANMHSLRFVLFTVTSLLSLLHPATANTCSQVGALNATEVKRAPSLEYLTEQQNYWSTGCSALKPSCILFPKSTEELASIVKVLNNNNETFAVKSGGHNPNEGFSSIQSGPLISTKDLNEVR